MNWIWLIPAAILCFIGALILNVSLRINRVTHKEKSIFDYAPELGLGASGSSFVGGIMVYVVELLFALTIGVILKYSPWWLAKALTFLVSLLFFYWSVLSLLKL